VATLIDGPRPAGYHNQAWDLKDRNGRPVANGVYLFQLKAGGFQDVGKLVIIR
jgi:hypothetical protein